MGCGASKKSQVTEPHVQNPNDPSSHTRKSAAGAASPRHELSDRNAPESEIEDDTPAAADADMHADLEELERFKAEAAAYVPSADEELLYAALQGNTEVVKDLLAHNVSPDSVHPVWGMSALHAACSCEQVEILRLLVPASKDPDHYTEHGLTASAIASVKLSHLLERLEASNKKRGTSQSRAGKLDVKGSGTAHGGMVRFAADNDRCCTLEDMLLVLREKGADWSKPCTRKVRDPELEQQLRVKCQSGPELRQQIKKGWSWIVEDRSNTVTEMLQSMVRRFGSVWEACDGKGPFTLREILALHRQWEVFPGFDINLRDACSRSLLHASADSGSEDAIEVLLAQGCNASALDARAQTALHYASRRGHGNAVRLLLDNCPELARARDHMGRTALHLWDFGKSVDLAALSRLVHASELTHDILGQTALHVCASRGSAESFATLSRALPSNLGAFVQEKPARKAPHFTSLERGGWAGDPGWVRAGDDVDRKTDEVEDVKDRSRNSEEGIGREARSEHVRSDPRGAVRPPVLWSGRTQDQGRGQAEQREDVEERKACDGTTAERASPEEQVTESGVSADATGRTALEVALVGGNEGVVHAMCGREDWTFPSQDAQVRGVEARLRLAREMCKRCRGSLVPAGAMRTAWSYLRAHGSEWPDPPGPELLHHLAREGELSTALGGTTLLAFACQRGDAQLLRDVEQLALEFGSLFEKDDAAVAFASAGGVHGMLRQLLQMGVSPSARIVGKKRVLWFASNSAGKLSGLDDDGAEDEAQANEGDEDGTHDHEDEDTDGEEEHGKVDVIESDDVSCVVDAVLRSDIASLELLLLHSADCAVGANARQVLHLRKKVARAQARSTPGASQANDPTAPNEHSLEAGQTGRPVEVIVSALHVLLRARRPIAPHDRSKQSQRWAEAAQKMVSLCGEALGPTNKVAGTAPGILADFNLLFTAIRKGYRETALALLQRGGEWAGLATEAMFEAVRVGDVEVLQALVAANADLSAKDRMGQSVLQISVLRKQFNVAVWLCERAWGITSQTCEATGSRRPTLVAELVAELMEVSMAQRRLVAKRQLVGEGGWRPCRACCRMVKRGELAREAAACDHYEEQMQRGEEEQEKEEVDEDTEEEDTEEEEAKEEEEEDTEDKEGDEVRCMSKVETEREDFGRRDIACLCSRAGARFPLQLLLGLWNAKDRLRTSLLPWMAVEAQHARLRRRTRTVKPRKKHPCPTASDVKAARSLHAPYKNDSDGKVSRPWHGAGRQLQTLSAATQMWWAGALLDVDPAQQARLRVGQSESSSACKLDVHSLAIILAACEGVLVGSALAAADEKAEGAHSALTLACLTGVQEFADAVLVRNAADVIVLASPGQEEERTAASVLEQRLVTESHIGVHHLMLVDRTLEWVSPLALAGLTGSLQVTEALLRCNIDCSTSAKLRSGGTLCALRCFLNGAPPIWREARSDVQQRWAKAAETMARLGGGREEKRTEKEESRKDSESVVALAIRKGYREAALALLEGSVDQLDLGAAVLVCAVKECDPELVDALVLKGADVYGVDQEDSAFQVVRRRRKGTMAVCLSEHLGAWDALMLLAACGSTQPFLDRWQQVSADGITRDMAKQSVDGRTLLMHAVEGASLAIVDAIVQTGLESTWAVAEVSINHAFARRFAPVPKDDRPKTRTLRRERNRESVRTVIHFRCAKEMHPVLLAADHGREDVLLCLLDACSEPLDFEFEWQRARNLLQICAARGLNRAVQHLLRSGKGQNVIAENLETVVDATETARTVGDDVGVVDADSDGNSASDEGENSDLGLDPPVEHLPMLCALMNFNPECVISFREFDLGHAFSTSEVKGTDAIQKNCYLSIMYGILSTLKIHEWWVLADGPPDFDRPCRYRRRRYYMHREPLCLACSSIPLDTDLLSALERIGCSSLRWACIVRHIPALHATSLEAVKADPDYSLLTDCLETKRDVVALVLIRALVDTGVFEAARQARCEPASLEETEEKKCEYGEETRQEKAIRRHEVMLNLAQLALDHGCTKSAIALVQALGKQIDKQLEHDPTSSRLEFVAKIMVCGHYALGRLWADMGCKIPEAVSAIFSEWILREDHFSICWHSRSADWNVFADASAMEQGGIDLSERDHPGHRTTKANGRNAMGNVKAWDPIQVVMDEALLEHACFGDASSGFAAEFTTTYREAFTEPDIAAVYRRPQRFPESKSKVHRSPLLLAAVHDVVMDASKSICLWNKGISPERVSEIERALGDRQQQAFSLDLTGNALRSRGVSALVGNASFQSISTLSLACNSISHLGAETLARSLPGSLQHLDLDCNILGDRGAAHIAAALAHCQSLLYLSLANNGLRARGFKAIAASLPKCRQLEYLGVSGNAPGDDGNQALALAVAEACSAGRLRSISACGEQPSFRPCSRALEVQELVGKSETRMLDHVSEDVMFVLLSLSVAVSAPLTVLDLSGSELGDQGTARLCELLSGRTSSLEQLLLCSVQMTCDGLNDVALLSKTLERLIVLRLRGNDFSTKNSAENANTTSAQKTDDSTPQRKFRGLGTAARCISSILGHALSLEVMDLGGVGIDSAEIVEFSRQIQGSGPLPLKQLDLGSNLRRINNSFEEQIREQSDQAVELRRQKTEKHLESVRELARVLRSQAFPELQTLTLDAEVSLAPLQTATHLDLRHCKYSVRDMSVVSHFLAANTNLQTLDLSRHAKSNVVACLSSIRTSTLETVDIGYPSWLPETVPYHDLLTPSVAVRGRHSKLATSVICKALGFNAFLTELDIPDWNCLAIWGYTSAEADLYAAIEKSERLVRLNNLKIDPTCTSLNLPKYLSGVGDWLIWSKMDRKHNRSSMIQPFRFSARLAFLTSVLRRCHNLNSLSLSGTHNQLDQLGVSEVLCGRFKAFALSLASGAPHLKALDLTGCVLGDAQVKVMLVDCKVGTALTTLSLRENKLTDKFQHIASAIPDMWSNLVTLDLSQNQLVHVEPLRAVLEANTVLTVLKLSNNMFRDSAVPAVCDLIRGRRSLLDLDIHDNSLGSSGMRGFADALSTCTSLHTLNVLNTFLNTAGNGTSEQQSTPYHTTASVIPAIVQLTLTSFNNLELPDQVDRWKVPDKSAKSPWEMHELVVLAKHLSKLSVDDLARVRLPVLNPEVVLSGCDLDRIPDGIVLLTHMISLDISDNCMEKLPVPALCKLINLNQLKCTGNPRLVSPPPEISSQGPDQTMQFLRLAYQSGEPNHDMLFVAIGDGESGKTSVINAITSENNTSERISEDTRTVGIDIRSWIPDAQTPLKVHIMDLAGQAVYSMSHQFFLVRRGIYVLVWRAREVSRGTPNVAMKALRSMVLHWMDSLQLKVPGATIVLVVTHIDCVGSEDELNLQTEYVKKTVFEKLRVLQTSSKKSNVLPLQVLRAGESFRVNCLNGQGIQDLRTSLIQLIHQLPWYGEQIPESYLKLRDWVSSQIEDGEVRRTWIDWARYSRALEECGLDDVNAAIATSFLHELGTLKYFAEAPEVLAKAREWHPPLKYLETLEDTVYISPHWIIDSLKGLMRHDREALLGYFSQDGTQDRSKWLRRVHRLSAFGIMHEELVPYMWPSAERSKGFWEWARTHVREGMLWERDVATCDADYLRVLALLQGCDIIHRISDDEFVAPGLLSKTQAKRVDARAYSDESCLFGKTVNYHALPPGFFERVIVRCRRVATHMDFTSTSAVLYRRGLKAQVFVVRGAGDVNLEIRASSRRQLTEILGTISSIENFFPGMHKASTKDIPGTDDLQEPVQVEFIVATQSINALKAAKEIQELLLSEDLRGSLSVKGAADVGLNIKFPSNDLLWAIESAEEKAAVIAKECFRRSVPALDALHQAFGYLRSLLDGSDLLDQMLDSNVSEGRGRQLLDGMDSDVWAVLLKWPVSALRDLNGLADTVDAWPGIREREALSKLDGFREVCRWLPHTQISQMALELSGCGKLGSGVRSVRQDRGGAAQESEQVRESLRAHTHLNSIHEAWLQCRALQAAAKAVCHERQWQEDALDDEGLKRMDEELHGVLAAMPTLFEEWQSTNVQKRANVVHDMKRVLESVENEQEALSAATTAADESRRKLQEVQTKHEQVDTVHQRDNQELKEQLKAADSARKALAATLSKITTKDVTELRSLKRPPFSCDFVVDMIAVLKREALPPMEMDSQVLRSHGEMKEFQVFRVHGQHHHHFATRPDFLQDLLAFPVDRVTDEDMELLQPYLERLALFDLSHPSGWGQVAFVPHALQWIQDVCGFHKVGNTPRMQDAKAVALRREQQLRILKQLQTEFETAKTEKGRREDAFANAMQLTLQHVVQNSKLDENESVRCERKQWFERCTMLFAAEVISTPVAGSLRSTDATEVSATLNELRNHLDSKGLDKSRWRAPDGVKGRVGFGETIKDVLLDFLFILGRVHETLPTDQESSDLWDENLAEGSWVAALHKVCTGTGWSSASNSESCGQTLGKLLSVIQQVLVHPEGRQSVSLGNALKVSIKFDVSDEQGAKELDLLRRLAGIPVACLRVLEAANRALDVMDSNLKRLEAMEKWLEGLGSGVGDVEEGLAHLAWWTEGQAETELSAHAGNAEQGLRDAGWEREEAEEKPAAAAPSRPTTASRGESDAAAVMNHAVVASLARGLRDAQARVPSVLRRRQVELWVDGGGWKRERAGSVQKDFEAAIARGANPELAQAGSVCHEACRLMSLAISEGDDDEVDAALEFVLDQGVSPCDKVLSVPDKWLLEDCPAVVDCLELATIAGERDPLRVGVRERLRRALRVDISYVRRLHPDARPVRDPTRLEQLCGAAPDGEQARALQLSLRSLNIQSFAELLARKSEPAVSLLCSSPDHSAWLPEAMARIHALPPSGPSDVRVVLVCMDKTISEDLETLAAFRDHAVKRRAIIPVIFPGFDITDYSHWWPDTMPELASHALFVDCRDRTKWQGRIANELLPQVNKFLEEWRGEAVDPAAFREVLSKVPCHECVRCGIASQDVHFFNRESTHAILEQWRSRKLLSLQSTGMTDGDSVVVPTANSDGTVHGDSEETLTQTCSHGHAVRLLDVMSKAVIYEAVPCPQCVHHGVVPPFCFNRRHCLLYFNEDNAGRVGAMECSKCLAQGRPASIRILDIIAPEVFLSYNWGVMQAAPDGTQQYSTQALVKPLQQRLESEEDVVCWFDVGGGMGAGQNLKAEMEEGIRKCTVVVIFLADSYLNSDNCKREFCHAVRMCKFLIPVLVPDGGSTRYGSSGWTGAGLGDPQWWKHAAKKCERNAHPDTGHPIAWSALQHFEPIDMRGAGQALAGSAAELEIRRRISSRFHRGEHIKHSTDANYALWSRARAKVRHALARRRVGKPSVLFPDLSPPALSSGPTLDGQLNVQDGS